MSTPKSVRILLVGDDAVGKTSLILTLVSEEFPDEVPARAEEITITADVTPERVPSHIVDFSTAEQSEEELFDEIEKADVIAVVYALNDDETIRRITDYWLPTIQSATSDGNQKPIVLVGNKADAVDVNSSRMEDIVKIMDEYPEVETCIECSARDLKNISELFYYAQKAVLHPTAPLYSNETKELTERCFTALERIFTICDVDSDGLLSDVELNEFQRFCFKSPLPAQGLIEVKGIVRKNIEDGLRDNKITFDGFLFLQKLFIMKGRQEITWTALRKFGYGHDLELRDDYVCPRLEVGPDSTVELSVQGMEFVRDVFCKFDLDEDDALSEEEKMSLFCLCPVAPWDDDDLKAVSTNADGLITLDGFISLWVLSTYLNHEWTLANLAYLGFIQGEQESQLPAVRVTRSKSIDLTKRRTNRNVFMCYVFGPPGSGKTAFLQGFINRTLEEYDTSTSFPLKYTANSVDIGKEIHLILHEVAWDKSGENLNSDRMDIACFLYDASNPDSFSKIGKLHQRLDKEVPCMFVATKSDISPVKQNYVIPVADYCKTYSQAPIQSFSALDHSHMDRKVFEKLASLTMFPYSNQLDSESSLSSMVVTFGLSLAAAIVIGVVAYRFTKRATSGGS